MAISPPIKRSMDAPLIPRPKPITRHKFRVQNFHVRVRIRLFERSQSSYSHGSVQSYGARQQGAAVAPSLFVFSRSAYRILHSGSSVFRGSVDFLSLLSSKILFGACNVVIVFKTFFQSQDDDLSYNTQCAIFTDSTPRTFLLLSELRHRSFSRQCKYASRAEWRSLQGQHWPTIWLGLTNSRPSFW